MNALEGYLWGLQAKAERYRNDDVILWPRTPLDAMQYQIRRMVGVGDLKIADERSRTYRIVEYLENLEPRAESVLDICCGDAIILGWIRGAMEWARCYGLDWNAGEFDTHKPLRKAGVDLFRATLQDLLAEDPPGQFDVAMMLNTYRGWESADLRRHESELPMMADRWLRRNCKRAILTATAGQVRVWKARGCEVVDLGRGEQDSRLVVVLMKGE